MRASVFASDPALLISVRFSVAVIGKCSWPPITRSISGNRSTSARSVANVRCVTATITVAPSRFRIGRYWPAAASGSTIRECFSLSGVISSVSRHSPMKPTFSAPNVFTRYGGGAADRLAGVRVDDVRDDPFEAGFPHALDQDVVAEVELVVAERREIQPGGVQRGDHLLAFEDARRDRRRQEVAGHHQERRAAGGGELLLQRRDARQAAEAVDRDHGVDVVDLQERDAAPSTRGPSSLPLGRHRPLQPDECPRSYVSGFRRTDCGRASHDDRDDRDERATCASTLAGPRAHLRQIDVAAAQDDADARAANRRRAFERRGGAERAGRLDDQLQPLPQIEHRPQQRRIVDRDHVAGVLAARAET